MAGRRPRHERRAPGGATQSRSRSALPSMTSRSARASAEAPSPSARGPAKPRPPERLAVCGARAFSRTRSKPKRVHDAKTALRAVWPARASAWPASSTIRCWRRFWPIPAAAIIRCPKPSRAASERPFEGDLGRAADLTRHLGESLAGDLDQHELRKLYEEIELPLAPVLAAHGRSRRILIDNEIAGSPLDRARKKHRHHHARDLRPCRARPSTSTRPSNSARCCSRTWALPTPGRRGKTKVLLDRLRRAGRPRRSAPHRRQRFSSTASTPSSKAPTSTRCRR